MMSRSQPRGFSLVEVVLAMGVTSFALVAILGLLAAGMRINRESDTDTLLAGMALSTMNHLRATYTNWPTSTNATNIFFDSAGATGTNSFGTADTKFYQCSVEIKQSPAPTAASLFHVRMTFTWPYPSTNNNRTLHATLAH
jgi:uncharacterized protein (TIGR02598 family)